MNRPLPMKRLRRSLRSFGVDEDPSRGKGSHTIFFKVFPEGEFTYPVPTDNDPVLECYVKGCRKRFRLTPDHGVTDEQFYGAA